MSDLSSRFKAIKAAAGADPTEHKDAPTVTPDPVGQKLHDWPRAEILAALEKGASSYALTLALQALADLAADPGFATEAVPLAKPTKTGEEWKRAYKTYARYAPQIIDAGRRNDNDAACDLFGGAAQEVGEIYSSVNPGDPMAETLAVAVYEALSRCYDSHRPQPA